MAVLFRRPANDIDSASDSFSSPIALDTVSTRNFPTIGGTALPTSLYE